MRNAPPLVRRPLPRPSRRKGVVSVVSMMFLILFGSLAAAMAIMSKGNVTTAATHQHVVRALGAAETGLAVAQQRLAEAAGRFVVERGEVDSGFGQRLWTGSFNGSDGLVEVQPPSSYAGGGSPAGMAEALAQIHQQDQNTVVVGGMPTAPTIGPAPSTADPTVYIMTNWVHTPPIALTDGGGTAFQISYAPLVGGTQIRAIVTGYDFDFTTRGQPVTRRIIQDFGITKRVDAAILSPSKVMIGKNVFVEGDMGATYSEVTQQYGDPLIMKSDFWGLDSGLDAELAKLFTALAAHDTDKDNRLRVGHPIEGPAIPDYSNLGYGGISCDVTRDRYVDEFDVFLMFYDQNHDGMVVLSDALTAGTPNQGQTPEFVGSGGVEIDDDLGYLLDSARRDRNKNGVSSFVDSNLNGRFDPGVDTLNDKEPVDPANVPANLQSYIVSIAGVPYIYRDQVLGFRDGVVDRRDQYAKVLGKLIFRVSEAQWAAGQGTYMERVRGAVDPDSGSPVLYGASASNLPDINGTNFTSSETALRAAADGDGLSFYDQVAQNLGIAPSQIPAWVPANNPAGASAPKFYPLLGDTDHDALPDNWQTAYFEKMPFNSPSYTDYYYRPVFENMVFHNVEIPEGVNGLFKKCQFIGVTYVRARNDNNHINWTLYGKLKMDSGTGRPVPDPGRYVYTGTYYPPGYPAGDLPVVMATDPMDKGDIASDQIPFTIGYGSLPPMLIINNRRIIDSKPFSNNIRFHDCLFVGSVVGDAPQTYTNARNKLQFTGATKFSLEHPEYPGDPVYNPDPANMPEIERSSMMLPNYSVDLGNFNSPPTQDVRLKGVIVAGVLDVRGNADIEGALLLTFHPVLGQAPLIDQQGNPIGNPAMFNSTIGYFGPADGDDESLDPNTLPIVGGVKIVGWDLDGDGLPDLGPNQTPTAAQVAAGAVVVPFYGYGRINLRFDPKMGLPDGILLRMKVDAVHPTYKETAK